MREKNKKAVSLMVSYVLLVVIAISMSILVYYWLTKWVPKPAIKCHEDTSLVIYDFSYDNVQKTITIVLKNKGGFNVSGYDIKGTNNASKDAIFPLKYSGGEVDKVGRYYFEIYGIDPNPSAEVALERRQLKPGETTGRHVFFYDVNGITSSEDSSLKLEKITIQPFRMENEYIAYCSSSIISLEVGSSDYVI